MSLAEMSQEWMVEQEVGVLLVVHIEREGRQVAGERKEVLCQWAVCEKMDQGLLKKKILRLQI